MTGKLTVVLSLLLSGLLLSGPAEAKKKKPRRGGRGPYGASSRVVRAAEAHGEATLRVRSIDFTHRTVVIELAGFLKAPAGNLFTFTDDRGRRFIATNARCDEPFPSGARVCDLETPEGYERHPWVGLDLHLHGLQNSAVVAAPREEVERAFEAARALAADVVPAVVEPQPEPVKPVAKGAKPAEDEAEESDETPARE
ncbi:MAG: hypothetical protein ABI321_24910 [Polyangia bacterium]